MAWILRTATETGSADTAAEEVAVTMAPNQIQFNCT